MRNSIIMICKGIKLDKSYQNVLTYTEQQMYTLCYQNKVAIDNKVSFIKGEENTVIVDFTYEDCMKCNYMAFQNPRYSNKWFFAFIDSVDYVSDKSSRINFTIDIFATWYDYWTAKDCFVIREHTNDDTIGANTIPEGLDTGEYINSSTLNLYTATSTYICVGVSEVLTDIESNINVGGYNMYNITYNGIYSGLKYLLCDSPLSASKLILAYDKSGKGDAIYTIFLVPQNFFSSITFKTINIDTDDGVVTTSLAGVPGSSSAYSLTNVSFHLTPPDTIGSYTIKNNKLKTFPYCYLYVTNNIGSDVIYHYEDFIDNTGEFSVYGSISQGCSIKAIPLNYKKLADSSTPSQTLNSFNYGIVGAKLPVCSWVTDPYINWLTQQGVNIAGFTVNAQETQMGASVGSILLGTVLLATGVGGVAGAGLIAGGAMGVYNAMQSEYQHDMIPQQAKGSTNSGDVQYGTSSTKIQLYKVTIREEFARSIDDYLTRFGYKTNKMKLPNQTGRTYFNFVQIGSAEIIGYPNNKGCPSEAMEQINNMYRSGVTLWHDHSRIGNYSDNTIVQNNT